MCPKNFSVTETTHTFDARLAENVSATLRVLLESKHLYQSERVAVSTLIEEVACGAEGQLAVLRDFADRPWIVLAGYADYSGRGSPPLPPEHEVPPLRIDPPIVKLYCRNCDRIEPFHVSTAQEIGKSHSIARGTEHEILPQNYELSYICQACRGTPEVFLVRREGDKLSLCGRSPIEHVDVPNVVPKGVRNFYSNAVVAFQSGQVLAANFLLRVVIEQWVLQSVPQIMETADKNLETYVNTLPEDFRSRFPTLKEQYSKLSADIHRATGSPELFQASQKALLHHFDARRLYQL
jgi:hypothetical protein